MRERLFDFILIPFFSLATPYDASVQSHTPYAHDLNQVIEVEQSMDTHDDQQQLYDLTNSQTSLYNEPAVDGIATEFKLGND